MSDVQVFQEKLQKKLPLRKILPTKICLLIISNPRLYACMYAHIYVYAYIIHICIIHICICIKKTEPMSKARARGSVNLPRQQQTEEFELKTFPLRFTLSGVLCESSPLCSWEPIDSTFPYLESWGMTSVWDGRMKGWWMVDKGHEGSKDGEGLLVQPSPQGFHRL